MLNFNFVKNKNNENKFKNIYVLFVTIDNKEGIRVTTDCYLYIITAKKTECFVTNRLSNDCLYKLVYYV